MLSRRALLAGASGYAATRSLPVSAAEDFPTKPIHLIVGFGPGASTDFGARVMAEAAGKRLGQPVIVDNKPGAASMIASDAVSKSPPDGYTLLMGNGDGICALPAVKPSVPYRVKDFSYICRVQQNPQVLAVNISLPVHSVGELIEYAKKNPGQLRAGSSGVGGIMDLSSVLLAQQAGVAFNRIPFTGAAPALTAVMGNFIDVGFWIPATINPHAKAGKVRILAVTSQKRIPLMPDVPTVVEAGYPDLVMEVWAGIIGPPGIPAPVLTRLRNVMIACLNDPEVKGRFDKAGLVSAPLAGDDFEKIVADDYALWSRAAKAAHIEIKD
jgi:tripartite-type tricarboxylate transporter receptor subunit TctC